MKAKIVRVAAAALLLTATLAVAGRARAETPAPAVVAGPVGDGTVNLNTATVDELVRLPGIGPSKAAAICAFRERHGPFRRLEDLDRVKGFGRKLIARVKPFVALSGPTTYVGKPHAKKEHPQE